jgi:hypothetical protein
MYKGGCLYPFSLSNSKAIKSRIKFYLLYIKSIKCLIYLRTRAIRSRSITIYKCASLTLHINVWRNNIKVFQNLCWRCPAVFRSMLARLMWAMLLHHTVKFLHCFSKFFALILLVAVCSDSYANSACGNMLSQLPWCSVTKLLNKSPRLLLTTSVCPSVCGW